MALRALRAIDHIKKPPTTTAPSTPSTPSTSTANTTASTSTTPTTPVSATKSILRPPGGLGRTPIPNGRSSDGRRRSSGGGGRVSFAAPLVTCELYFDAAQSTIGLDRLFDGGGTPTMEKLKPAVAANSTMSGTAAAAGYRASFLGSESSDDDQAATSAADTSANLTPRCAIKRMKTEDDTVVVTSIEVRAREEYDCGRMTLRDRGAASPLTRIDLFKKCSVKKEEEEEEEDEDEDEEDDDDDDDEGEEETIATTTTTPPPNMPTDEELAALETDDMTDYVEHLKSRAAEEAPPVPPTAEEMTSLLDLAKEAEEDQAREEEEARKRRKKEDEEAAAAAAADMIAEEAAAAEAAAAASTSAAGPSSSMSAAIPFTSEPYDEPMLEMQMPVKLARSFHAYLGRYLDAYDHRQAALKAKERRRILNIFDEESLSYEEEAGSSPITGADDGEGADIDIDDTASDIVRDTARRIGDPTLLGNLNPW